MPTRYIGAAALALGLSFLTVNSEAETSKQSCLAAHGALGAYPKGTTAIDG